MGELSEDAAALLRSGRGAFRPDGSDRARILESLRQTLGDAAVAGGAADAVHVDGTSAARAAAWKSPWVKALGAVSVLAVGAGVTMAIHSWTRPLVRSSLPATTVATEQAALAQAPPAPAETVTQPVVAAPRAEAPSPLIASEPVLAASANRPRPRASARTSADSLAEEVRLLSTAERQLNEGSRESALATLADHERRFPRGALTEARMAVRVEALCGLGRMAEARSDLRKLAIAYPASPHLDAARRLCGADIDSP